MRTSAALLASAVALLCVSAVAQLTDPVGRGVVGARRPAISPDGSRIAFQYRGDIYVAPAEGGTAIQVTNHVELDTNPIWSPDGKWIAFSTDRNGNMDVYAIPSTGGELRRLTYSGFDEVATDWSPDGEWITFAARREAPWTGVFVLNVRTLQFRMLSQDYQGYSNPRFSPDGKRIVVTRHGFPWTRARYAGSAAAKIVVLDVASGAVSQFVSNERQHLWPTFAEDNASVYAVTYGEVTPSASWLNKDPVRYTDSADKTPNLWRFDRNGRGKRVTSSVGAAVRWPSISKDGTLCYERDGRIYTFRNGREAEVKISVFGDQKHTTWSRQVFTSGAEEAEISPDGKTFAFRVGSEVWTVPLDKPDHRNKDDATRLTDHPGVDQDFTWSADGKRLFFISDRDYNERLFELNVETKEVKPIWTGSDDAFRPTLSPDGRTLAFWVAGAQGGIYLWQTDGFQAPRRVVEQPGSHFFGTSGGGEIAWSPDSRWIAYTAQIPGSVTDVLIADTRSGEVHNISRRNVDYGALGWSADGKYLYYQRSGVGGGFMIVPLQPEDAHPDEIKLKYAKPEGAVTVEINFDGISERARRFFSQSVDGALQMDVETGKLYFLSGGNLWMSDYDGSNARQIVQGVASYRLAKDGKTAYGLRNGELFKVTLSGNFPVSTVAFRAELVQDMDLVRAAAFTQFYRMYNRGFYDGNFHGRDWASVRARYEPLLEGVGHRIEFSELLNMMVGELEASHTEVGSAPGGVSGGPSVSHPGFFFDYSHKGPGIRVEGTFERAPAWYAKTEIKPGEYVLAINGKDVGLNENLWETLHNQGGRDLVFLVNSTPSKEGAREVRYAAQSTGGMRGLWSQQWVRGNRARVEEATGGRVSYIHISGMGGTNRDLFEEEFWEYSRDRDAMIIDVRFNGGGNISDTLIDWLERKPHGYYRYRDSFVQNAPSDRLWDKPIVVLMHENSFSNAEMFPYAMKERGLATLVGMPTPGYVIWTWGSRLVDGTSIRMPMGAVYRMDGSPMENIGQQPDIRVPWTNEDFLAGRDPQLERAIQEVLRRLGRG